MQPITILGFALCMFVLWKRVSKARNQPPSSTKKRLKTAHLLLGALLAWLVININLHHLSNALSGESNEPPSTWERVVKLVADWSE